MKPMIGVMPLWDETKDSIWMLPGYFVGIEKAGGIPVMFPFTDDRADVDQLVDVCDGILFTGGHDVSPEIYHEDKLPGTIPCIQRDCLETIVLRKAIETDKPILGICRGIQFINAALGGSLYQDIPTQRPSATDHRQAAPYDIPSHTVRIKKESPLYECLKTEVLPVNSCHHQAVRELACGLEEMALAEDGLIEALYMPSRRFLWAVQWHPEFSYKSDENSMKIFRAFIMASSEK